MRLLLAPTVTSSDRSTSTIHTESLRPLQIYPYYKRIIPSLTWIPFIPLLNLYQSAHSNVSPFSTSRCPSIMASIIEIVLYSKPTTEHQYLLRSSCRPLHTKRAFPFGLALIIRRIRDVQSRSPQPGDTTSRKFAKWTSRREPELS